MADKKEGHDQNSGESRSYIDKANEKRQSNTILLIHHTRKTLQLYYVLVLGG